MLILLTELTKDFTIDFLRYAGENALFADTVTVLRNVDDYAALVKRFIWGMLMTICRCFEQVAFLRYVGDHVVLSELPFWGMLVTMPLLLTYTQLWRMFLPTTRLLSNMSARFSMWSTCCNLSKEMWWLVNLKWRKIYRYVIYAEFQMPYIYISNTPNYKNGILIRNLY